MIVDAIVLLTGKFDRNLVYRQELKKTGNTEPDTLGQMVAIMGIALPTMGGNKKEMKVIESEVTLFFCVLFSHRGLHFPLYVLY